MNITPASNVSIPTVVNPQTDTLRRENNQREVIAKPEAASQSAAEKGVASERERAKSPGQHNEQVDFVSIRKQAELANSTISDEGGEHGGQQDPSQDAQQSADSKEQDEKKAAEDIEAVEQQEINALQKRDSEVRSHELAHASVGGSATGTPSYSFQVGPDGKQYAVGGEVSVDLSTIEGDPSATIAKMQKVYSAALAPANPSTQDERVASAAAQIIAQAQSELVASEPTQESQSTEAEDSLPVTEGSDLAQESNDFDTLINNTLKAQEELTATRPSEIDARAGRIESFYATINMAYEKPSSSQFVVTA